MNIIKCPEDEFLAFRREIGSGQGGSLRMLMTRKEGIYIKIFDDQCVAEVDVSASEKLGDILFREPCLDLT